MNFQNLKQQLSSLQSNKSINKSSNRLATNDCVPKSFFYFLKRLGAHAIQEKPVKSKSLASVLFVLGFVMHQLYFVSGRENFVKAMCLLGQGKLPEVYGRLLIIVKFSAFFPQYCTRKPENSEAFGRKPDQASIDLMLNLWLWLGASKNLNRYRTDSRRKLLS